MLTSPSRSVLAVFRGIVFTLLATAVARAAPLGNYQSHVIATNPDRIEITDTLGNRLRLRAYGNDMIRVQAVGPSVVFSPDDRYLMVENHNLGGALSILGDSASSLLIANGDIRLTVSKTPLRLAYADAAGVPLLSDSTGIDLDPTTLRYVFTPDNNENFMGYGQKRLALQDTFQLAGRTERRNYGEEGYPGRGAQGVLIVPFYMSNKGYGFYANTTFTHEGRFNNAGDYSFRVELKNFSPPEADYFFIYGPEPAAILDHYTKLTGRPRMPRKAIFGLHLSDHDPLNGFPNQNEDWWKATVTAHFNAGFPLDHMVYDNNWRAASPLTGSSVGTWGGSQFAFDPTRYPDPAEWRQWYDARGLMLTLDLNLNNCNDSAGWLPSYNIPPYTATNTASNSTSDPDYSNPATRAWLWQLFWDKALNPALGYPGDAIWLDESDGIYRPDGQLLANGRPWHEMKNYYFFLTAQAAVADGWDNAEGGATPGIGEAKRPWVWIRGGSPGMQRYATHWTGDINFTETFYHGQIIGMQASGLAGFPFFNHDAGGFGATSANNDPTPTASLPGPDDNFYIQWLCGFGTFSPIWRPHGYNNPRWPANRSAACQTAFRRYATQRYEMMPYIYTIAHLANQTGLPMARPMPLAYPDSPVAWEHEQEYQYMWGDSLLVAPAFGLDGSDEIRTAWLPPAANWYDFWTDTPVGNGTTGSFHTFNARFGFVPIFVKAGAIIPRQDLALTTAALSDAKLTLDVYKGGSGSFTLIEDDGVTERFRTRSEQRFTTFTYTETANPALATFNIAAATGTYTNASANRSYIVRLHGFSAAPLQVTVDGAPVAIQSAPLPAGDSNLAAWDAENRLVLVRVSTRAATSTATIVITPPDTPIMPTAFAATAISSSQINLAWTDIATNETGFKIIRKAGMNGIYAEVATVAANATSYSDTGLSDQTQYFYRICATNANGDSSFGPETDATTFQILPIAPSGLVTTTLASDVIGLTWVDNAYNETGYQIERSLSSGSGFTLIGTVGTSVTSFNNTGLPANSTYFYRIRATNAVGTSAYTAVVSGTTVPPPPPAVPTDLTATIGVGTQINLTWTDTSTNELGFKLQRKTGTGGTFSQIATLPAGTTSYADIGLAGNTTYFYRLAATNLGGDSAFSNQVSATTPVIGTVTMTGGDASGSTSFDVIGKWSNAQAPSAANDYVTNGNTLRTPHNVAGNVVFAGNSLTISANGTLLQKGLDQSSVTINALKLNGGRIRNGWVNTQIIYGNIQVVANSILDPDQAGRVLVLAAPLSGSGNLTLDSTEGNGGILRLAVDNPAYTGNWIIPNVLNRQATLQVGDGGPAGSLGTGTVTNDVALIFKRSGLFTVANPISGTGTVSLTGTGTMTLLGTHTYTGTTTLSGGTLLVNATLGNTTVTAGFGTLLGGTGTINGPVSVLGDFAPGANGIGTLTVNNAVTLSGGATFELNTASTPSNDRLVATAALYVAGSLVVVNTGPALVAGDTFALFNKAPGGNFATVTLPALSPGLAWQNDLATEGTLRVVAVSVPPYDQWAVAQGLTPGVNDGPTSDPDHDGLNNLGEFALGSSPTSGASDGRLAGKFATVSGSQAFTFTLPARNGAVFTSGAPATSALIDGIIYQVQSGTGLDAWTIPVETITGPDATAIQSSLPAPPPGYAYHSFRLDLPPNTPGAFVRARITGAGE